MLPYKSNSVSIHSCQLPLRYLGVLFYSSLGRHFPLILTTNTIHQSTVAIYRHYTTTTTTVDILQRDSIRLLLLLSLSHIWFG